MGYYSYINQSSFDRPTKVVSLKHRFSELSTVLRRHTVREREDGSQNRRESGEGEREGADLLRICRKISRQKPAGNPNRAHRRLAGLQRLGFRRRKAQSPVFLRPIRQLQSSGESHY